MLKRLKRLLKGKPEPASFYVVFDQFKGEFGRVSVFVRNDPNYANGDMELDYWYVEGPEGAPEYAYERCVERAVRAGERRVAVLNRDGHPDIVFDSAVVKVEDWE